MKPVFVESCASWRERKILCPDNTTNEAIEINTKRPTNRKYPQTKHQ